MFRTRGICSLLLLFGLTVLHAWAQRQGADDPIPLRARVPGDAAVILDVVTSDQPGQAGMDAHAGGFVLRDNGKAMAPSSLKLFDAGSPQAQVQLVIVLDAINSSLLELGRSEDALEHFLQAAGERLARPLTILIASDTQLKTDAAANSTTTLHHRQLFVHRIPASNDPKALLAALKEYRPGLSRILEAQGGVGQPERVRLSLEALSFISNGETAVPGAKLVVWMSPGWPYLAESDARSSQQLFDSVIYFSDLLREARMILYSVNPEGVTAHDTSSQTEAFELASRPGASHGLSNPTRVPEIIGRDYYKSFLKGVTRPGDADPNDLALQVLAIQSGGLVLPDSNDMKAQLDRCAADALNVTTLAYIPVPGGRELYRAITVKSSGRPETLRTRAGFYLR